MDPLIFDRRLNDGLMFGISARIAVNSVVVFERFLNSSGQLFQSS